MGPASDLLEMLKRLQQRKEDLSGQFGYFQHAIQDKDEQQRLLLRSPTDDL